jgi:probable F420-dependent oxidoreductase
VADPADHGWKRPADHPSRAADRPDRLQFGVVLQTDPPAQRVVELAKMAEHLGFSHAWTFDSHVLWQEPFVIYSRILDETETLKVGPMVTNPGTRDWTVLASLFATLNEMYGDRTICGMGRGDSALRYIGRKPTTLTTMVEAMEIIKDLVAGKEVSYNDELIRFPWIEGPGWDLPMWVAGYGPKALRTVGRHADGFILQLADPQVLQWTMDAVRAAAEDVGRNPDEIEICVVAPAYVGDDIEHQREQLRWFGGMVGNHVADMVERYGEDNSKVPQVLSDYIKARAGYDYDHHGKADNPSTDFVPDEIVDRFCVLGTVEQHVEKLNQLKEIGADHFGIYLMHDDREATLRAYGEKIIPAVNG